MRFRVRDPVRWLHGHNVRGVAYCTGGWFERMRCRRFVNRFNAGMKCSCTVKKQQQKQDKDSSPAAIPNRRGKIAEQAAAVKGKMNGAYCAARSAFVAIKGATD